jgi:hypothetical protein
MNDKNKEEEVKVLKEARMEYPTWDEIKKLLGVQFDNPELFDNNPLSIDKENASIYSNIDGNIIKKYDEKTPCGIDIPVLLKPKSETDKPLIVILGESALRNKAELEGIKDPKNAPNNVILGTPYAIHLKECPPKCGVYRKIFDAILEKGYPIYITDIIKVWWKEKKLVPDKNLDITVFNMELKKLKDSYDDIIIVAWGKTAQNGLEKVRKDLEVEVPPSQVPRSLSLPHPGVQNWDAWKLKIFADAIYNKGINYAKKYYENSETPTTDETVVKVAMEEILSFISNPEK